MGPQPAWWAALAGISEHSPPLLFSLEAMRLGPCSGLLVDWLEMLDPEVISSCPDLQQRLLFSWSKVGCVPKTMATSSPGHSGALCLPIESWAQSSSSQMGPMSPLSQLYQLDLVAGAPS